MARSRIARRAAAAALLLGVALAALAAPAAAQDEYDNTDPDTGYRDDGELPWNVRGTTIPGLKSDAEVEVADQMLKGFLSVAQEINTGEKDDTFTIQAAPQFKPGEVNVAAIQAKVFGAALARWQMGVVKAPSNRGLKPSKFQFYDRWHYYQIPENPIGTFVMFHGCYHDASGSWPYDPEGCPECLGLPEEVAHTKQALKYGYAVLAVESKNRTKQGRCFNSGQDPAASDMWEAPYIIQNFLYEHGLQNLPIVAMGISAGASFAVKLPKAFYDANFGDIIKMAGVISEVNAIEWEAWGLVNRNGKLRFPGFPPVAFLSMLKDTKTHTLVMQSILQLRYFGIQSDYIPIQERLVTPYWFSDRSPTITAKQSLAIVDAMYQLGFIDGSGRLAADPRVSQGDRKTPLFMWNQKLVQRLPWLHMDETKPPMLSTLSDRSAIFEEMNVAYAWHEGIADHIVPCLVWFASNGTLNLQELSAKLSVSKLADLTMDRVYASPPPPALPVTAPPALVPGTLPGTVVPGAVPGTVVPGTVPGIVPGATTVPGVVPGATTVPGVVPGATTVPGAVVPGTVPGVVPGTVPGATAGVVPGATGAVPGAVPGATTTVKPTTGAVAGAVPGATTAKPATGAAVATQPATGAVQQPAAAVQKPATAVQKPATAQKPAAAVQPVIPQQPAATMQPAAAAQKPAVQQPVAAVKPAAAIQPAVAVQQPVAAQKPVAAAAKQPLTAAQRAALAARQAALAAAAGQKPVGGRRRLAHQ